MREKQIVFFDLDGTLLTSELKVANSSIEAIQAIKKRGIEPVIATGRTISEISSILEVTGIFSCVAMNGQYVVYQGELIYENQLDRNEVRALHRDAERNGHDMAFYNTDTITVTAKDSELIAKNYQRVGSGYPPVDASLYLSESIYLMILFCEEGEEAYYQEHFPYFQFVRNSPFGCDVYPAGTSKATGVKHLLSHQNLSSDAAYAFGDGLNDIEMCQLVKNTVAMGNAVDEIKQLAK
jgi:Cof subfamily protein (haloacid dehalogenase superfamily)